jgi:heat shock protein HtpX
MSKAEKQKHNALEENAYNSLNYLRAQFSAQQGKPLSWDDFFELLMSRERQRNDLISWLHSLGVFIAITVVLMFPIYLSHPLQAIAMLPLFVLIGLIAALFSAYVLTPWTLRGIKPYSDAPPEMRKALEELAAKARLKRPLQLMIAETPEVNAMAYTSTSSDRVCVTRGLILAYQNQQITFEELKAILGHEIGHIRNYDCLRCAFVLSWISIFDAIGTLMIYMGRGMARIGVVLSESTEEIVITRESGDRYVARREPGTAGVFIAMTGWFFYIAGVFQKLIAEFASALAFYLSRKQEFAADQVGAELSTPEHMASALKKIEELSQKLVAEQIASLPYADRWQLQPRNPSWTDALFDTHPPTDNRVDKLAAIGKYL